MYIITYTTNDLFSYIEDTLNLLDQSHLIMVYGLFNAMVNGIVFLISLSDLLFLVYINPRYFCVLILDPANLPNSLMSSSSFW